MFKIENINYVTEKNEFVENVMMLKEYDILFSELSLIVEFVNYMNVFDRQKVEICQCDDSYCLTIYDYPTNDILLDDMYFEELDELCQYVSSMYFEDEE